MLRFFLSSRYLRLRHRLLSLAERSASILAIVENENGTSENCGWGLSLVFQLLRGKLAIATWELAFPLAATTDEDTWRTLWKPNAGGDDE